MEVPHIDGKSVPIHLVWSGAGATDWSGDRTASASGAVETSADVEGDTDPTGKSLVFVTQQYPPDRSGHASRIRDTATSLADEGWDVTVLTAPPSFPPSEFDRSWRPVDTETVDGVTVRRLWTWQPTSPDPGFLTRMAYYVIFAAFATLWIVLAQRNDVVVTSTPPISTGLAGFPAALLGRCWVVDVRDLWIDASVSLGFIAEGGLLERGSRRCQKTVLRTANSVAVTTPTLGDSLCDQYGEGLSTKTVLVPNGVDVSRFTSRMDGSSARPAGERADQYETELSNAVAVDDTVAAQDPESTEPPDPFVVIYTGNIGHAQDLDTCVRALEHLSNRVVLRLVGGGDAVPRLERLASEVGVADRVEFVGTVPHERIPSLLAAAHVGVAPLVDDPELAYAMPTKVYEYLGAQLPVVVTGEGELKQFVERSGGGLHADNDPKSAASAIERLAEDDRLRTRLGEQGHEHVREWYDRTAIANQFSDHLHRLVDGEATDA